MKSKTGGPHSW